MGTPKRRFKEKVETTMRYYIWANPHAIAGLPSVAIIKKANKSYLSDGWKPIGKTPDELYLRWLLDGYTTGVVLVNRKLKENKDIGTHLSEWRQQ